MTITEGLSVTSDADESSGCGLSSAPPMWRRAVAPPVTGPRRTERRGHRDERATSSPWVTAPTRKLLRPTRT